MSTRAQRRGSRTTNACEACKKRKTKCTGPPGPCDACTKVDTFCHFNLKLDTRRKVAYKPTAVRERQQYILQGLMQSLKHNDARDVQLLLDLIREEARPHQIAACLRKNIQSLQDRRLISTMDIDETDLVSLGLQGLYSHRAGRQGGKQTTERSCENVQVSVSHSAQGELLSDSPSSLDANERLFRSPSNDSDDSFSDRTYHASSHDDSMSAPSIMLTRRDLNPRTNKFQNSQANMYSSAHVPAAQETGPFRHSMRKADSSSLAHSSHDWSNHHQILPSQTSSPLLESRFDSIDVINLSMHSSEAPLGKSYSHGSQAFLIPMQGSAPEELYGNGKSCYEPLFGYGTPLDSMEAPSVAWPMDKMSRPTMVP